MKVAVFRQVEQQGSTPAKCKRRQHLFGMLCALVVALPGIGHGHPAQAAPAFGDQDLCGLHTLLILEQAQKHPQASYARYYRGIMAELINSSLMHGQPNNRKIVLLNEAQRNASIAYPQRHRLASREVRNSLKKKLWHDCSARLAKA